MSAALISIICIGCALTVSITVCALWFFKPKKYEPTHTVTDEFKERPTPSGVYLIIGPQGSGKTSLMNAVIDTDFKYHGSARLNDARTEIKKLNALEQSNPYKLTCPACAYRTRTKLMLSNGKPTYHTDISQFGLPQGQQGVQYFPVSTVIGCDEVDSFMDCRKWQEDKQYIIDGMKYIRHQNLVLFMDAQSFDKCDADIRRLVTDVWYITKKKDIYERRRWWKKHQELVRTEWTFNWIKQQQLQNAAKLRGLGIDISTDSYSRKCKFIYEGNIYNRYNSLSGKPYWYAGIKDYEIEKHPMNSMSRAGVETFCKQNALRFEQKKEKNNKKEER